MKLSEMQYQRPDIKGFHSSVKELTQKIKTADSYVVVRNTAEEFIKLKNGISRSSTLAHIRFSQNTKDAFYSEEQNFLDANSPLIEEAVTDFFSAILESPFRADLEKEWGGQIFRMAELQRKVFSSKIIELSGQENELSTRYTKILGSAQIELDGQKYTLSQLRSWTTRPERLDRKRAAAARDSFFVENARELDEIYDELVNKRHEMAQRQGYASFVEMGYDRMTRTDYSPSNVEIFRKQILDLAVPLADRERKKQQERLAISEYYIYDESIYFPYGNAKLHADPVGLVEAAQTMYSELSEEAGSFFRMLRERELMDLESRDGKAGGGYCTFITEEKVPFIFSNFNGTTDDVEVLTHETGHAFQSYLARELPLEEIVFPTMEAAEIHSMSMEYITYPWMHLFFGEDAQKFKQGHLLSALYFFPYAAAVDEYQHRIYYEPKMSPEKRRAVWKEMEQKYLPWRKYDGLPFYESGGLWQTQSHIYRSPFYYIDYALAQVSALEFWQRSIVNKENAWKDYVALSRLGGSLSYQKLLSSAGLSNPFDGKSLGNILSAVDEFLSG